MSVVVGVCFRDPVRLGPYLEALQEVGLSCLKITPGQPYDLGQIAGLVLTGGTDVDPALYGQARRPETDQPDRERDEFELQLIHAALQRDMPILAICRGMQMLNVALGGTLHQHLEQVETHRVRPPVAAPHEPVHPIEVLPGTLLARIIGAGVHYVNSRHHQAVDQLGRDLVVAARAPDGVVEALELPAQRFVLACQWHPEDCVRTSRSDRKIFEAFRDAL